MNFSFCPITVYPAVPSCRGRLVAFKCRAGEIRTESVDVPCPCRTQYVITRPGEPVWALSVDLEMTVQSRVCALLLDTQFYTAVKVGNRMGNNDGRMRDKTLRKKRNIMRSSSLHREKP
ncbi:hypothetical protein VTO42DRAFT_8515 [Malbranchea cinnamomea]